ncbi:hypothetical protein U9R90_07615 [Streptomyces sp. E11-3]|uniref:HAAS signaling domain-containing protein n=1 Tax=Streptomyces sp. E11-3 TaxID=3110112 RepID=UPI003980CE47
MSTSTLTERYVYEVVRRLPADQRDDIGDELRTTIADTVEASGSADPRSAEREVLSEMGDPVRCAARYADRPLALIGPDLYPTYIRLLVMLLSSVLPVITVGLVLLEAVDSGDLGAAIGTGVETVFTLGAQMFAGLTLVFAVAERVRGRDGMTLRTRPWTPDDLPEIRRPDKGGAVLAGAGAVWDALLFGLIVWQHTAKPYRLDGDGERIELLDPALWSGWIWPVLFGLAALVVVQLARVALRGWTVPLAAAYTLAQAVFALPLAWVLYRQDFLNPEFLADTNKDWSTPGEVATAAALIVVASAVSGAVRAFRAARG